MLPTVRRPIVHPSGTATPGSNGMTVGVVSGGVVEASSWLLTNVQSGWSVRTTATESELGEPIWVGAIRTERTTSASPGGTANVAHDPSLLVPTAAW